MRYTSRKFACAVLASSIVFVGFSAQFTAADAATTSSSGWTNWLFPPPKPAPAPTPAPAPKPTPPPKRKPKPKPTRAQKVIKWAAKEKGKPYQYGADGPRSFDCSGLVQYVYKKAGKKIGRTSGAQLRGKHIAKGKKRKGDIMIFMDGSYAYHSAIYAGDGKMWEAQRSGTRVGKHKIWSSGYVVRRP